MIFEEKQKTYPIDTKQVWEAFKQVRASGGSAGVDGITIETVGSNPRKYLYPVWSRMASGSYFPKPVRQVLIPKNDGTKRSLGIPTVVDRVAQMVVKQKLEKLVDKHFSVCSFGYRPDLSAHDAIERCRVHCMRHSWVIDLDIKGFFDNIDHELMMQFVKRFTQEKYIILYIERWLKASIRQIDGTLKESEGRGTPQGGVISPLLANIFLHFVFDMWIGKQLPKERFERYADDIIIHCSSFKETMRILEAVKLRLREYKLELNQSKTKIVYCHASQKPQIPNQEIHRSFDFLGFTFKPRIIKVKGIIQIGMTPAISRASQKRINEQCFKLKIHRMAHLTLDKIANILRSKTRGWINYYGKFRRSDMHGVFRTLNFRLARWVRNKYRRFRRQHWYFAYKWLVEVSRKFPTLFVHWEYGFRP